MSGCICSKLKRKPQGVSDLFKKADFDNGTALTPPMGWSSWNCFRGNIDEDNILDTARAMVDCGLKDAGYTYINLDDCWMASERNERGELYGEAMRFPSDMGKLISKVNEIGLKVGLYTSNGTLTCEDLPSSLGHEALDAYTFAKWGVEYFKYDFCHNVSIPTISMPISAVSIGMDGKEPLFRVDAKDMRLEGRAKLMKNFGTNPPYYVLGLDANDGAIDLGEVEIPCSGRYSVNIEFKKTRGDRYVAVEVDGDVVAGMRRLSRRTQNQIRRAQCIVYLEKGVRKIRLLNPVRNKADSAMLQYVNMANLLKNAAEKVAEENGTKVKPICFSICEWGANKPYLWGAKAGNLWRTTGDIFPQWHRVEEIYEQSVDLYPFAKPGHWNDPDMLEVGNGELTKDQNVAHFALWCMMAAPLILGNDLRKFIVNGKKDENNDVLKIVTNKRLIAIDQDKLGKPAKIVVKEKGYDVLAKPLENGVAVCLFNRNRKAAQTISFDFKTLTKDDYFNDITFSAYTVEDAINGEKVNTDGILKQELAPTSVAVFIIKTNNAKGE